MSYLRRSTTVRSVNTAFGELYERDRSQGAREPFTTRHSFDN